VLSTPLATKIEHNHSIIAPPDTGSSASIAREPSKSDSIATQPVGAPTSEATDAAVPLGLAPPSKGGKAGRKLKGKGKIAHVGSGTGSAGASLEVGLGIGLVPPPSKKGKSRGR